MFGFCDNTIDCYGEQDVVTAASTSKKRKRRKSKTQGQGEAEDATVKKVDNESDAPQAKAAATDNLQSKKPIKICKICGGRKLDPQKRKKLEQKNKDGNQQQDKSSKNDNLKTEMLNFSAWVRKNFGEPPDDEEKSDANTTGKKNVDTAVDSKKPSSNLNTKALVQQQTANVNNLNSNVASASSVQNIINTNSTTLNTAHNPITTTVVSNTNSNTNAASGNLGQGLSAVTEYHRASRLHFLGTWRERFEKWKRQANVESLSNKEDLANIQNSGNLNLKSSNLWAYLDMDAFFCSVATKHMIQNNQQHQQQNQQQSYHYYLPPAAVVSGHHSYSEVCSANYAARNLGVTPRFVRDAKNVCPTILLFGITSELLKDVEETWKKVYLVLVKHSPFVDMRSCDEVALRIPYNVTQSGSYSIIKTWTEGLKSLVIQATEGPTCSIGIGTSQIIARLASKSAKPDGVKVVVPMRDNINSFNSLNFHAVNTLFMKSIPLTVLPGVGRKIKEKLEKLSIQGNLKTCGDLVHRGIRFARYQLGGKVGENIFYLASGVDPHLLGQDAFSSETNDGGKDINNDYHSKNTSSSTEDLIMREKQQRILQNAIEDAQTNKFLKGGEQIVINEGQQTSDHNGGDQNQNFPSSSTIIGPTKRTISSDMNFGIRPFSLDDFLQLLTAVSNELETRIKTSIALLNNNNVNNCKFRVSRLTLRLLVAGPQWVEPPKIGGHGHCEQFSRGTAITEVQQQEIEKSMTLNNSDSESADIISKIVRGDLFNDTDLKHLIDPLRVRGVGLTANLVNNAENTSPSGAKQSYEQRNNNSTAGSGAKQQVQPKMIDWAKKQQESDML